MSGSYLVEKESERVIDIDMNENDDEPHRSLVNAITCCLLFSYFLRNQTWC